MTPLSSDITSATLSLSGAVEMFIGKHTSVQLSDCTPIIGSNGFTTDKASDYVIVVIDPVTETVYVQFPLDDLFIFESHPGQGMPGDALYETQVVDITSAIPSILAGGAPVSTVPITLQFISAPCSHAQFKFRVASLTIETVDPPLQVDIDIKPGSDPNCFNNNGHGVIPVAILGSAAFDASTVDAFSVALNGMGVRVKGKSGNAGSLEDVNNDGFDDMVIQIEDIDGTYEEGDTTATLTGSLLDGTPIEGTDSICIVP